MVSMTTGVGAMTWSPLACGIITGKYENGIPESSRASIKVGTDLSLFHWGQSPINSLNFFQLIRTAGSSLTGSSPTDPCSGWLSLFINFIYGISGVLMNRYDNCFRLYMHVEKYLPVCPSFCLSVSNCNFQSSNWNENVQQIFNQSQNYSTGTTWGTLSLEERDISSGGISSGTSVEGYQVRDISGGTSPGGQQWRDISRGTAAPSKLT